MPLSMPCMRTTLIAPAMFLASASAAMPTSDPVDPLRFFVGRTETTGRVKVMLHKSYATHSSGLGRIDRDGSLVLVQQVFDEGKAPEERRWKVRQVAPGHYTATMSEAVGPVTIDRVGNRYRFRFAMKGRLTVEQVIAPLDGGRSAKSSAKVRRLGMVVATTDGVIRKV